MAPINGVNTFDIGEVVDPQWLSQTILHESTLGPFWTRFLRENYVTSMGYESVPLVGDASKGMSSFSGAPIETFSEFEKGGLDKVNIPLKLRYRGEPRHGRAPLQGTGEGVDWLFREVQLWNSFKAFNIPVKGEVDHQILREKMASAIEDEVRPGASEWLMNHTEPNINWTLLTGYSSDLTPLRGEIEARNTGIVNFSHPNIFVAGHGRVAHGNEAATRPQGEGYETAFKAAVNTCMQASPSVTGMSTERLIAFRNDLTYLGVRPVKTKMGDMFCLALKPAQYTQLELEMGDRAFRDTMIQSMQSVPDSLKMNPFFGNAVAVYQQMILYINPMNFGIQTTAGGVAIAETSSAIGMPAFGPSGPWVGDHHVDATYDQNDCAIAVGFGAGFLSKAYGKRRMWFTVDQWDHEKNKELGMHWWCSYQRSDVFDPRNTLGYGVGAFGYNDTSALLVTNSPFGGSY